MQYGVLDMPMTDSPPDDVGADLDTDDAQRELSKTQQEKDKKRRANAPLTLEHVDIIKDEFWERRPWLLSDRPGKVSAKSA